MTSEVLTQKLKDVILKLSIHPAGMTDWNWYEQLCLECADELDGVVLELEGKPDVVEDWKKIVGGG